MLHLQALNLEHQERLFKSQIKLGLRQILHQELAFYNDAFNNISSCASILAGFAFTGMMLQPYDSKSTLMPTDLDAVESSRMETVFNFMCALTTCLCLLTVIYSNYLSLFVTRLALRGGEMAVEQALTKIRAEYKVVLYSLTASVECFILTLPILAFYKMEAADGILVTLISVPSAVLVMAMYRRARFLFYLDKTDRFAANSSKNKGRRDQMKQWNASMGMSAYETSEESEAAPRLSDMVNQLDERNDPYLPSREQTKLAGGRKRQADSSLQADAAWAVNQAQSQEKTKSDSTAQMPFRRSRSFDSAEGAVARYSGPSQPGVYGPFPHLAPTRPFDYNYGGQAQMQSQYANMYAQENRGNEITGHRSPLHRRAASSQAQKPTQPSQRGLRGFAGLVSGKRGSSPSRIPPGVYPN